MKSFKELFEAIGLTKTQLHTDYKTKLRDNYRYEATFSKINKINGKKEMETLYFKDKLSALGHADKYKKEFEAGKQF